MKQPGDVEVYRYDLLAPRALGPHRAEDDSIVTVGPFTDDVEPASAVTAARGDQRIDLVETIDDDGALGRRAGQRPKTSPQTHASGQPPRAETEREQQGRCQRKAHASAEVGLIECRQIQPQPRPEVHGERWTHVDADRGVAHLREKGILGSRPQCVERPLDLDGDV